MTEQEWLACTDPGVLIRFLLLGGGLSGRKYRLLACYCCRDHLHEFRDDRTIRAIETAERDADGLASHEERQAAREQARQAVSRWEAEGVPEAGLFAQLALEALDPLRAAYPDRWGAHRWVGFIAPGPRQCSRVRDMFGNPFRPVTADPAWLTPTVVALARGIYADRAFDRLPILADALQDAGCEDPEVLAHCRSDGPHVRGCWVVDLVLGKE
jgi:hypothetical protein